MLLRSGADKSVGVIRTDPYLEPFKDTLKRRYAKAHEWIENIDKYEGGLEKFSRVGQPYSGAGVKRLTRYRVTNTTAFRYKAMEMSFIGNGLPMLCGHTSLVILVCQNSLRGVAHLLTLC